MVYDSFRTNDIPVIQIILNDSPLSQGTGFESIIPLTSYATNPILGISLLGPMIH